MHFNQSGVVQFHWVTGIQGKRERELLQIVIYRLVMFTRVFTELLLVCHRSQLNSFYPSYKIYKRQCNLVCRLASISPHEVR